MSNEAERTAFDKAPIGRHLIRLRNRYRQSLNRLWLGHGAAILATLSFIGANWKTISPAILVPLASFASGLIFLGLAEFCVVLRLIKFIKRYELSDTALDFQGQDIESPLATIDIHLNNLVLEMLSAAALVFGVLSGLLFVFCHLGR